MSGDELRQRLAAILAADVAGYSRLMAADEHATVVALDAAVFRAQVEANRGEREPYVARLSPNDSTILFFLSWTEASAGNVGRAKDLAAQALRMSPRDRWVGMAHLTCAMCAFVEQDLPALREWAELAIQSHLTAPIRRVLMIAYAAEVGDAELRRTHLVALQRVAPDFIPSLFRGEFRPFRQPEHMTLLLDSLRKAGFAP